VNILLFQQWHQHKNPETQKIFPYRWIALAVLAIPIGISQWIGNNLPDQSDTELEVAVLQPNIDPYEKVSSYTSFDIQLQNLIRQSEENITENTALLIWPETALYRSGGIGEKDLTERGQLYDSLWTFLRRYPRLTLFTGVESYGITSEKSPNSIPAPDWLRMPGEVKPLFVESYNGAAVLDSNGADAFYLKVGPRSRNAARFSADTFRLVRGIRWNSGRIYTPGRTNRLVYNKRISPGTGDLL
jgi:apolipoprotein N-acyltransferase